jgi:hypothetical protein
VIARVYAIDRKVYTLCRAAQRRGDGGSPTLTIATAMSY